MTRRRLVPGTQLGRFRLVERIAMGGMAEIWAANAIDREERVALKILQPHLSGDAQFRAMFVDEVKIALRLRHENIVRVHDGRYEDGHFFLVMDLIDGLDLRRVLKRLAEDRRWVPTPVALSIGRCMVRGLAYAHLRRDERGRCLEIIHRDISPHNVMLSTDGRVRLLDFGIARARARHARTRTGVVKGKTGYMAPEQALGTDLDQRTDIFATGIVLWETLAMQRLFSGGTDLDTMDRVIAARVPTLLGINETVPEEAAQLIHRMLLRSPKERPQSMREVESGLARALARSYRTEAYSQRRLADWLQGIVRTTPRRGPTLVRQTSTATVPDDPTQPN